MVLKVADKGIEVAIKKFGKLQMTVQTTLVQIQLQGIN
jgi:hypothetical protein